VSVSPGTIWRPTAGRAGTVVVRSVTGTVATVVPWPQRGRPKLTPRRVPLTANGAGLVGYTATGQRG
jgi:hypothetical protein